MTGLEITGARLNFVAALLYNFGPFVKIVLSSADFLVRGGLKNVISFTARSCVGFECSVFFSNKLHTNRDWGNVIVNFL